MIPRILEVQIRGYRSIAEARASLEPFTAFVGPNGSGKSNFIDALAFVQECLDESVEFALKNRGGTKSVARRSGRRPWNIGIRLSMALPDDLRADYSFEIAPHEAGAFSIARERCVLQRFMGPESAFEVENGQFSKPIPDIRPRIWPDRLALFAASATEEFRPVYDFLTSMRFYSVVPVRLRELQAPDPGLYLKRDASNAAAVLKRLAAQSDGSKDYQRLCRLLSRVVQGLQKVEYHAVGQKETLQFIQDIGLSRAERFEALNMSDGTLRALGVLLAVYQPGAASVVAIEEPEATVHPAVMELIVDVLMDAANTRQILITTHSPDVLDHKGLEDRHIRAVALDQGRTLLCPLSNTSRQVVRDGLYTPGELLRSGELNPDVAAAKTEQLDLFGPCPAPDSHIE
ncbi:MAG: hypothetical protein AMK72_10390 [Planctomycetes bacterium SM23_25]|nr:MAG: hypothetical protein AMK72_10390 [Planctomycetes bacterium SM23_25]